MKRIFTLPLPSPHPTQAPWSPTHRNQPQSRNITRAFVDVSDTFEKRNNNKMKKSNSSEKNKKRKRGKECGIKGKTRNCRVSGNCVICWSKKCGSYAGPLEEVHIMMMKMMIWLVWRCCQRAAAGRWRRRLIIITLLLLPCWLWFVSDCDCGAVELCQRPKGNLPTVVREIGNDKIQFRHSREL